MILISGTDIPNILIITPSTREDNGSNHDNDDTFDLVTSRFVTRNNGNESLRLDTFYGATGKFASDALLFPNKFNDLEGRIMRVALFNYKPYSMWNEVVRMDILAINLKRFSHPTEILTSFFSLLASGMPMK